LCTIIHPKLTWGLDALSVLYQYIFMVPMVPFGCSENLLLAQKQRSGAPRENILIVNPYISQIVESTIKNYV
jgi:hypothetical protein